MTLKVYLDESIDIARNAKGVVVPTMCGYIATAEDWGKFAMHWSAALKKHHARYFHFREFTNPKLYKKSDSPYYGWSETKRTNFLFDMATEAGLFAIPVGGLTDANYDSSIGLDPHAEAITACFGHITKVARETWPNHNGKVLVTYDKGASDKWTTPMKRIYNEFFEAENSIIGPLVLGDDKAMPPLQAADMLSYAARLFGERGFADSANKQHKLLDFLLNKNVIPSAVRELEEPAWRDLVAALRKSERSHNRKRINKEEMFYVTKQLVESYDFDKKSFT